MRPQEQAEPPDSYADRDRHYPDRQGPQEFSARGRTDGREARNRQRERAEPGPGVQADEDQRSDARGQQARYQHKPQGRPAQPGGFHQQERAVKRRAEVSDLAGQAQADGPILVVAIDMPIGLPDRGRRVADVLARAAVGPLRSSVFMTPVRAALEADDHPSAVAVNRELAGEGISVQAFGLKTKLFQVESWIREAGYRVVEVHPEVCFAQLAGAPLSLRKATWAGAEQRRDLLAHAGVTLAGDLGVAGHAAAVDDVLDAAVAAWTARRVARGEARSMPDPPEAFTDGLRCAIWA